MGPACSDKHLIVNGNALLWLGTDAGRWNRNQCPPSWGLLLSQPQASSRSTEIFRSPPIWGHPVIHPVWVCLGLWSWYMRGLCACLCVCIFAPCVFTSRTKILNPLFQSFLGLDKRSNIHQWKKPGTLLEYRSPGNPLPSRTLASSWIK